MKLTIKKRGESSHKQVRALLSFRWFGVFFLLPLEQTNFRTSHFRIRERESIEKVHLKPVCVPKGKSELNTMAQFSLVYQCLFGSTVCSGQSIETHIHLKFIESTLCSAIVVCVTRGLWMFVCVSYALQIVSPFHSIHFSITLWPIVESIFVLHRSQTINWMRKFFFVKILNYMVYCVFVCCSFLFFTRKEKVELCLCRVFVWIESNRIEEE